MIKDIAKRCGVRTEQKNVPLAHGFRKFFTTQMINSKVNPEIREMLLGHKIGLASVTIDLVKRICFSSTKKQLTT